MDPFVGDRDRLREAEPRVVKPDGDGGDVVITVREHQVLIDEHGRVVGGGAQLGLDEPDHVSERGACGRVGLGEGSEAERILEVSRCAGPAQERAAVEQLAQPLDGGSDALVRSQRRDGGIERGDIRSKTFKRECGRQLQSAQCRLRARERERGDPDTERV